MESASKGESKGGQDVAFALVEDGVDLAPFHDFESKVPQAIKDAVAKAKEDVKSGKVKVPTGL